MEILLAESQERMCYEVAPEDVARVEALAERFDLGCSVIGEVTDGNYVCEFAGAGRATRTMRTTPTRSPRSSSTWTPSTSPTAPDERPRERVPDPARTETSRTPNRPSTRRSNRSSRPLDREQALGVPPVRPRGRCSNRDETRRRRRNHGDPRNSVDRRGRPRPGDQGVGLALSSGANPNWTETDPTRAPAPSPSKTRPTSPQRARSRWPQSTASTAATRRSPRCTAASKGSSTGSPTPAPTSTPRWSGATSRCTTTASRGRSADADPRADRHQKGVQRAACRPRRPTARATQELLLIGAGGADGGALGGSESTLAQAGEQTGSRRCRTRRPRVLPTASRRSQRSPATNRRSRPTT